MELSRMKDVPDTPQFRAPFENLTIKADNALLQRNEEKKREIEQTKTDLKNQYLVLKRNRNERFSITEAYVVDKLTMFIGYERANQFKQRCIEENEELEIAKLGQEFIAIARKPTFDRDMKDEDRKREILTILRGSVPQSQLDEMVQEALREESRVKQKEKAAELRRQRVEATAATGSSKEQKEEKKQDSLGLLC